MYKIKLLASIFILSLLLFSCGSKDAEKEPSPDINIEDDNSNLEPVEFTDNNNINHNITDVIQDLRQEVKYLKSELDYQYENLSKLEAQTQVWTNPFAIYNKEIVLNNGSSIFGKIVYQDQDVMKVETLIGQLIIDRNTIVRVVNQIKSYSNSAGDNPNELSNDSNGSESSGINLIQNRINAQSANLVLVGEISEEKDGSDNTVLKGEIKNVGNKRADFAKIIFTFRTSWQGDTKTLTAFINGVTNTFDTGISSDNSILPHAVGNFELIIPRSFGSFIGYSYEIDWSQYDE
tara:strand:- start:2030 stop:2902 length:873 start_codon:yes stop_codon:yes gene_type:complete